MLHTKFRGDSVQFIQLEAFAAPRRQCFESDIKADFVPEPKAVSNGASDAVYAYGLLLDAMLFDAKIEHFDEALDRLLAGGIAGSVFPQYVGPFPGEDEVPRFLFRAYFTDAGIFELLGHRYPMQPIVDEISDLHDRVLACCEAGHRIRSVGFK